MSELIKELAADYFERFAQSDECHITSDDRIFHTKGTADSFAAGLTDQTVQTFKRADFKIAQMEVVSDEDDQLTEEEKAEADAIASEKILAFDTEKATYEEAKELVKEMNLAKEGNKKEDLFNAIVAAQTAIKDKA